MLILTRKSGEKIRMAEDIELTVLHVSGSQVKIGIDAPKDVTIMPEEQWGRDAREIDPGDA